MTSAIDGPARGRGITATLAAADFGREATGTLLAMPRRLLACFVALASLVGVLALRSGPATAATSAHRPQPGSRRGVRVAASSSARRSPCPSTTHSPTASRWASRSARLRATQPAQRIGSLVFNFGGPGDAGSETLRRLRRADPRRDPGPVRPRELRSPWHRQVAAGRVHRRRHRRPAQRGRSHPQLRRRSPRVLRRHQRARRRRRSVASPRNGAWLAQLGSRNVARDLDRLRAALDDDTLSFVGYSYGTVIGAVYAQMFPDRVGRMVLDSPVDLSADALEELRGNSKGFEQALDDFLADCAAQPQLSVPQRWRSHRRARHARAAVRAADSSSRPWTSPPAQSRSARPASPRSTSPSSPRSTTASSAGPSSPTRSTTPATATAATCSRWPTSTTAATTTAATTTSTRSSA